jgi:hypothetical protein
VAPGGKADGRVTRQERIPPRLLPVVYFGLAHAALLAAAAALLLDPVPAAGFFYQPRLLAVTHLVTLGWIGASILGSLYVIGPLALRTPMPARAADGAACAAYAVGVAGLVGHFWTGAYRGIVTVGLLALCGILWVGWRTLSGLAGAPIDRPVRLHLLLAFVNILGAGVFGVLLGIDKEAGFLPGARLQNVYAHAHLAAVGWAAMMVMGAGYRLIPMILPAAVPHGPALYGSAALLQAGVWGLAWALMSGSAALPLFALLIAAAFAAFLRRVFWMRRHPRRAPAGRLRPDLALGHAFQALAYAAAAGVLGLLLASGALGPDAAPRAAAAYGVFGLLGFLGQMVTGIESRILPWFAVYHANRAMDGCGPAPDPDRMPDRRLQWIGLAGWSGAVPLLAAGMSLERPALVAAGAALLLTAAASGAVNAARILGAMFRRPGRA